jgi:cell division protease FtsH
MNDKTPPEGKEKKTDGKKTPRRRSDNPDRFDWRKATRTLTFWVLLVILTWIVFKSLNLAEKPEVHKSYSQYQTLLETGQFDGAEVIDREFHGRLKDGSAVITTLPFVNADMLAKWDSLKIDYQFREKTTSWVSYLITSILPWVIIIAIWLYIMRRMQGGGARGVFSFGKSRAKLLVEGKSKVTFKDVAGVDEAKEELQEIIAFLRDPKKFARLGGRIPKGALLLGPPGTGKTLLARAVAGEAEVPFFSMSGADFVEMFVGVGAARVRDLFEQGKKSAPCIIFIDEIDAVGRHRGAGLGGGHDEREQTLNQLLVEMDGFESNEGVILLAATNRPDVLDPALTRPGRFDRQIVVDRPDVRGREGILKVHSRTIPLAPDVNLDVLAKGTPGLAGAELANLVNEAALLAARRNGNSVAMSDFEEAKDKVMMGTERKSMLISEDERRQTACHEAGHVLVSKLTPGADPVHKVTIIPRGRALGLTHYLPLDEKHNYSRTYLLQTLTHLMGGRAAEKLVFNELSTGAGNDIERATEIARKMICEWGMSDRVGPVAFGRKPEEIFLGRDIVQNRDFSERTSQEIDAEMRRIVSEAEKRAERLLADNRGKLNLLAEALLEREILDGEEIDVILKGQRLPPAVSKRAEAPRPQKRREPRQRRPVREPGEAAVPSSPIEAARARRDFARSYGVASSRDNENRRPRVSHTIRLKPPQPAATGESTGDSSASDEPRPAPAPVGTPPPAGQPRIRPRRHRGGRAQHRGESQPPQTPVDKSSSEIPAEPMRQMEMPTPAVEAPKPEPPSRSFPTPIEPSRPEPEPHPDDGKPKPTFNNFNRWQEDERREPVRPQPPQPVEPAPSPESTHGERQQLAPPSSPPQAEGEIVRPASPQAGGEPSRSDDLTGGGGGD